MADPTALGPTPHEAYLRLASSSMDPASVSRRVSLGRAAAAALAFLVAPPLGCSSGDDGAPQCVSSRCPAGNECIDDGSGKGLACHQVCTSLEPVRLQFVLQRRAAEELVRREYLSPSRSSPSGQWGAGCVPTGGETNNPSCDGADGFWCYGTSPTDANSFCTVFGCTVDTDCPGGWWCAHGQRGAEHPEQLDVLRAHARRVPAANVLRSLQARPRLPRGRRRHAAALRAGHAGQRLLHERVRDRRQLPPRRDVQELAEPLHPRAGSELQERRRLPARGRRLPALRRVAAARPSAAADSDCLASLRAGAVRRGRCACRRRLRARGKCQYRGLCTPRAGVCVGNGGFCSPCRSDADCTNGYCISSVPYSTERFCSVKSTRIPCDTTNPNPPGCPAHQAADNWTVNACVTTPANQCEGFVVLGASTGVGPGAPGCWTANR